ncbi:hypothetical protein M2192_005852 [Bradyrhizobium elkanii USDA 61]|nr:hypothetical protein [Bradyrhizobium elkanii]MCS3581606.1 hypothetical protein [Bradyrhizobium elkanii]MCS3724480.1 hypothetical protein [Bradyrhizobium elkanii]MCS4008892.1 hypothetical protein [Bradyrhizobium elkanii USDA 61]
MEISKLNPAPALTLVAGMRSRRRIHTEFLPIPWVEVNAISLLHNEPHQFRSRNSRRNHRRGILPGRHRTALHAREGYRYGMAPAFHPRSHRQCRFPSARAKYDDSRQHRPCEGDVFLEPEIKTIPSTGQNVAAANPFKASISGSAGELAHDRSVPTFLMAPTPSYAQVTGLLKTIDLTGFFRGALHEHLEAVRRAVANGHRNAYVKQIQALLVDFRELQRQRRCPTTLDGSRTMPKVLCALRSRVSARMGREFPTDTSSSLAAERRR